jgi:Flp pilus assembly protein TadB
MLDAPIVVGSLIAGTLCGCSVFIAGVGKMGRITRPQVASALHLREAWARLASDLERAGWRESQERAAAFAIAFASCLGLIGGSAASAMPAGAAALVCAVGIVLGLGLPLLALRSAINRRRKRLEGELVPLLELFTLELGGGGSPVSALGSVTLQVQGELAADLRRLLIASQVTGSASFESRLVEYSERLEIPAIGSLATILAAGREYGTGAVQGVRALATDLRRAQRRDLIAQSRRALNHVLLPAAIGVLLPFLAVLMFPAVTALQHNLR